VKVEFEKVQEAYEDTNEEVAWDARHHSERVAVCDSFLMYCQFSSEDRINTKNLF